ncbi:phosphotransferase [Microbacterium aurum]|uniref:phosphotransferase n=1 Tax=Microbacterium aurum TaxID=36805 RepID=UPI0028EB6283|nr:phosphotransferase [Microbacterium aurum]
MARSPLTLAASVTSALPRVAVVGVGPLTEGASGRYDSAIADLDDGRRVVVRVPVDDRADADLRGEARALASLTAGVRGVLPFGAPDVLGQTTVDGRHTLVQTLLPGYRVDAAHVPSGRGVATALGAAIAAVHDLPVTVIRDAGLPMQTAAQVRDEAERLLDRAEATGLLPFGLLRRWSTALGSDPLWRFETTVVLGGVDPASFVFEDDADGVPVVTGLLNWGGLGVGDPAVDLRWTASAPAAQADVLDEYGHRSHRAPDALVAERARLHAELEFAKWLVHGHATGDETVVTDAVALLESLDESVRDEPVRARDEVTADDAIAATERVPAGSGDAIDTSMQTDSFDADTLAAFLAEEAGEEQSGQIETVPIELSDFSPAHPPTPAPREGTPVASAPAGADERDAASADVSAYSADEIDRDTAAQNALRRWTGTA